MGCEEEEKEERKGKMKCENWSSNFKIFDEIFKKIS